jgi:hypothetical protein
MCKEEFRRMGGSFLDMMARTKKEKEEVYDWY